MNKLQFLSELSQYLTFISPEEHALVMDEYSSKFDNVGPEGEAALLVELGTPMMIAISLKRKKEAGMPLTENVPTSEGSTAAPKAGVNPSFDEACDEQAQANNSSEKSQPEDPDVEDEPELGQACGSNEHEDRQPRIKVGALISCILLSLLTAVFALGVIAVGVYFFIVMGNLLVIALQSLNLLSDSLLLFAGALVSGGVGLFVLWLGLWSAIRIISNLVFKTRA